MNKHYNALELKSLSRIFLIILITSSCYSFSSEKDKSFQEQSILSVLYVQTSTEFAANNTANIYECYRGA